MHSTNNDDDDSGAPFDLPRMGTKPAQTLAWIQAVVDLFATRKVGKKAAEVLLSASSKAMAAMKLDRDMHELDELRALVATMDRIKAEGDQRARDIAQGRTPVS